MGEFRRDLNGICRLCLSEDENILFPATKFTDSTMTVDDIELITGIRVITKENKPYAVCIDCKTKLRMFHAYRSFCLRNDVKFRKRFAENAAEATADSVNPEFANDRPGSTSPSETIEECNMMDAAKEKTIELEEIEDSSIDDAEKTMYSQRSYEDMHEDSYDSITYADNDTHIEPSNGNESSLQEAPEQPDKQESHSLITAANVAIAENPNTEAKLGKELCTLCGKLVTSADKHMLTHSTDRILTCEFCQKKYGSKAYLKHHVIAVHMKRIVRTCEPCNIGFRYVDSYYAHMRAKHNYGVPFECKICNLKFRHRGGLRNHNNQKHNFASNCECPICGMIFQDKKGLRDHSRVHSDEQPFACKYCPKRFKGPTACKAHQLIHEGVKFPCTICDKIYAYKTLLNAHMRKAHITEDTTNPDSS
ncbi:zinc finger protein 652-like [Anopheles moucheti]|uniref:zinc finger protein 652-like n=1 Tax=Anopheles moucheti TaxID=186751 RepID=UPI0022F1399C|nr:zinc finger protein 652-like [Anopheles moucheti]